MKVTLSKNFLFKPFSQNIWNELIENILPRLKDKIPLVKIYAISSLKRLQDPMEDQDEIIVEYFRLLSTDSNK